MRHIVLDTNCLIQVLPSKSLYHKIWTDFLEGKYRLCVSNEILSEYEEILAIHTSPQVAHNVVEVIANHQMSGEAVLAMLARITAGYIHQMQRAYDHAGADEVVEESFQTMLTAFLTDFDKSDVRQEIDKIKREQVN